MTTASDEWVARPTRLLWGWIADVAIFFYTVAFGSLAVIGTLITRKPWPVDYFSLFWSRWILKACGIHVDVEGLEHVDRSKSYVIISNHLSNFDVFAVDEQIAERAVGLRRSNRIKLPDAVIWATAQVHAMLLVTRNTKDFPDDDPGVRAPYKL